MPAWLKRIAARLARPSDGELPGSVGKLLTIFAQRREESRQQAQRALLLHQDRQFDRIAMFKE